MQTRKKETSLTEMVYRRLHADLVLCRFAPGAQLKAGEIAQRHDVSLAAVREALARLSSEGLVNAEPQRGFRAAPISADRLQDLTAVRIDIETNCLRQSMPNLDLLTDLRLEEAMDAILSTAEAAPDGRHVITPEWNHAHAAFHEALVAGCRSQVLRHIRHQLFVQSERYRSLSATLGKRTDDIDRDHRPLMDAVKRRDTAGACALMEAHINATTVTLLSARVEGRPLVPRE
jgi:DNA-binding GntR family transcriptional regulator